jgi:hypothetical protein
MGTPPPSARLGNSAPKIEIALSGRCSERWV